MAAAVVRRRRGSSSSQAWRAHRGRPGNKDGRFEGNDLAFERNTLSTANGLELMDGGGDSHRGCRGSKRLPCTSLEREEHVRDERLVLDLCGNGYCDPDGVAGPTVCNPIGQMTEVGRRRPTRMLRNYFQWKMSSCFMRCPDPDSAWNRIANDEELRI